LQNLTSNQVEGPIGRIICSLKQVIKKEGILDKSPLEIAAKM